jgi:two-component system response regulator YesN
MYKIVIVDDEEIVREGIRDNVEWAALGLEFAGEAEDGLQAYELVKKQNPDILLVDICMPHMDGLEFSRLVKDTHPDCKVIIVTGYDEFDYAQQAIRLGVDDYILKPITCAELTELLEKVVKELDLEKMQQREVRHLKEQLDESLPLLREKTLNKLINGELNPDNHREKFDILQINAQAKLFAAALIDIDNFSEAEVDFRQDEMDLIQFALLNVANEIMHEKKNGIAFKTGQDEIALIFYLETTNRETGLEIINSILSIIRRVMVDNLKLTMSIGIGDLYPDICDLDKSYNEARRALDYRFFLGNDAIINIKEIRQPEGVRYRYPKDLEKKLISSLKGSSKEEVIGILNEIFTHMKNSSINIDICRNTVIEMLIVMLKAFAEIGIQMDEIFEERINILKEINQFKTLKEIEEWVKHLYLKIASYIEDRASSTKMHILKVIEYIENNFGDKDLSFRAMCDIMHLSPSYFSLIFKKEMGETFIEYLTRVRMEKAKELLKNSSLRTYEIADRVGYSDPHYFSSIFKKVTNMSPTEYKEKVGGKA